MAAPAGRTSPPSSGERRRNLLPITACSDWVAKSETFSASRSASPTLWAIPKCWCRKRRRLSARTGTARRCSTTPSMARRATISPMASIRRTSGSLLWVATTPSMAMAAMMCSTASVAMMPSTAVPETTSSMVVLVPIPSPRPARTVATASTAVPGRTIMS